MPSEHSNSYIQFARKRVRMDGPPTEQLISSGKVRTPYPDQIKRIRATNRGDDCLFVLIPLEQIFDEEIFKDLRLRAPLMGEAIRFISQLGINDIDKNKIIIFPHDPPYRALIKPQIDEWLAQRWRSTGSETLLYHIDRSHWPSEHGIQTVFAGIKI